MFVNIILFCNIFTIILYRLIYFEKRHTEHTRRRSNTDITPYKPISEINHFILLYIITNEM